MPSTRLSACALSYLFNSISVFNQPIGLRSFRHLSLYKRQKVAAAVVVAFLVVVVAFSLAFRYRHHNHYHDELRTFFMLLSALS